MLTELSDRLSLIVDAKTDGAISNIRRLSTAEKAAADRADVLRAKLADLEVRAAKQAARPSGVSSVTAQQLSRTKSELAGLESTLATVPRNAGLAEKALARVGLQGTVTGSALTKGLGGGLVAAAAFGDFEFLKKGIDGYVALADQIRGVQQAASSSVPDASKLVAITTALGVDSQLAALGVFRLGKTIGETPDKLAKLGIAVARDKQGNTDLIGTLANVADAYQHSADGAQRAKIVTEAFGRSGVSLLPILNANKGALKGITDEAAKQGRIFNAGDLQHARDYQIATRELGDSWQSMGIALGKDVVPALERAAIALARVIDIAGKAHTVDFVAPAFGILSLVGKLAGGGGGKSLAEKTADEIARGVPAQLLAASQAAAATLADTSSLASGQGLADAKQNLADARQTLADAVALRNKATKELAAARSGAPGADATALEAAVARVHAAEAKLRAAQYVGGDARTSTAQASLLSAQDHLNKLRGEGGVQTNKLATATERLHKANEAVATAQRKEQEAQRAKNEATGLSATDVEQRLAAQLKDKTARSGAITKLAGLGASAELTAYLDALDKGTPGTLVKLAKGANAGLVAKLDSIEAQAQGQQGIYDSILGNPDAWRTAGADRAAAFREGFAGMTSLQVPTTAGAAEPAGFHAPTGLASLAKPWNVNRTSGSLPQSQVVNNNYNGAVTVQAQDPEQFGRKMAAKRRHAALSGGRAFS